MAQQFSPNQFAAPLRVSNPPLTPEQEAIVLGRGSENAPEPTTPEGWELHAAQSMQTIVNMIWRLHGRHTRAHGGYRPIAPLIRGVNVLYFDSSYDNFELRVQPPTRQEFAPEEATYEEHEAVRGIQATEARMVETPEYIMASETIPAIKIQAGAREARLSVLPVDPETQDPEEIARRRTELAETHARYLHGVAIHVLSELEDQEGLAELTPLEAHDETPGLPAARDPHVFGDLVE